MSARHSPDFSSGSLDGSLNGPALRTRLRVLSLAIGVCAVATPALVAAQITYFQRPPSPDELRAALLAPRGAPAADAPAALALPPSGTRSRGIVWQKQESGVGPGSSAATRPSASDAAAGTRPPVATAAGARPSGAASTVSAAGFAQTLSAASSGNGAPAAALPINFDLGSSRVDRNSMPYIETIAAVMRSDPSLKILVEGHTDDRGAYHRNMVLSWDRALGVFRALVETYGIEPTRLQPVGKGPLEPMPGTEPGDGSNRRVQFRISG